jgi:hypothetical protein
MSLWRDDEIASNSTQSSMLTPKDIFLFPLFSIDTNCCCLVLLNQKGQHKMNTTTNNIPTYEKIETIVLSYLQDHVISGTFGSIERSLGGNYVVHTDHQTFTVKTISIGSFDGWSVKNGQREGLDSDLLEAARMAVCH